MKKAVLKIAGSFADADIERITRNFSDMLGTPVEFDIVTDSSLIGGFAAYIDGTVYDASVLSQLKDIKTSFGSQAAAV